MEIAVITLTGPHDEYRLGTLVRDAEANGFHVTSVAYVDSETGQPISATDRRIEHAVADLSRRTEELARLGFGTVADVARLTMLDAWRRLHHLPNYTFSRISAYMAAHGIPFADRPATSVADGWQRQLSGAVILPELGDINPRTRTALRKGEVISYELLTLIPDAELSMLRIMSDARTQEVRAAQATYEAGQA